jgi:hypothetical protein
MDFDTRRKSEWNVTITNNAGVEFDISNIIDQISIYESLYNNCMFGNIKIRNSVGFIETFALLGSGGEKIKIDIGTPNVSGMQENSLIKEFVLNSLSDIKRFDDGTGAESCVIGFVSPFLIKNNVTKISRSFDAMSSSEIVEYISLDVLELGIDPTKEFTALITNTESKHTKNIVVPNWKPFQLFNFLSRNSISLEGDSNYIFFENNEGFNFTTLEYLKSLPPIRMISLEQPPVHMKQSAQGKTSSQGNIAVNYGESRRFDITAGVSDGMFGSKVISHNILTKKYEEFEITNIKQDSKLGDVGFGDVFKENQIPESHVGYMSGNYVYDVHDKGARSHYPLYDLKMAELRCNNIKFDIPGDTNVFAGNVVEVLIPSNTQESDEMDKYMSGNFLITAIHHKLNNTEYTMTVELSKDGFDYEPDESLMAI